MSKWIHTKAIFIDSNSESIRLNSGFGITIEIEYYKFITMLDK